MTVQPKLPYDTELWVGWGVYDTETTGLGDFARIRQFYGKRLDPYGRLRPEGITDIICRLQPHVVPSPEAMLITRVSPTRLDDGISFWEFAWRMRRFFDRNRRTDDNSKSDIITVLDENGAPAHHRRDTFAFTLGQNNIRFDKHRIAEFLAEAMYEQTFITNTGGNCELDTLNMARAVAVFGKGVIKVPIDPDTGNPSFRLGALCAANGITAGLDKAHEAGADVGLTWKWFVELLNAAPKIVHRMMENARPRHLVKKLNGTKFAGAPIFSLLTPHKGMLNADIVTPVGTTHEFADDEKRAIMFNLRYDPKLYATMSVTQLVDIMREERDRIDGYETAEQWRKQPPVFLPTPLNRQPTILPEEEIGTLAGYLPQDVLRERNKFINQNEDFCAKVIIAAVRFREERKNKTENRFRQPEECFYDCLASRDDDAKRRNALRLKFWEPKEFEFDLPLGRAEEERARIVDFLWRGRAHILNGFKDQEERAAFFTELTGLIETRGLAKHYKFLGKLKALQKKNDGSLERQFTPFESHNPYFKRCTEIYALRNLYDNRPDLLTPEQIEWRAAEIRYRIGCPDLTVPWMTAWKALAIMDEIEKDPKRYAGLVGEDPEKIQIWKELRFYYSELGEKNIPTLRDYEVLKLKAPPIANDSMPRAHHAPTRTASPGVA